MKTSAFVNQIVLTLLAVGIYLLAKWQQIPELNLIAGAVFGWALPSPQSIAAKRASRNGGSLPPPS